MPEFFTLVSPGDARKRMLEHIKPLTEVEQIATLHAVGRVLAQDVASPQSLPEFPRSTVDGYAVRAADTFGASDSLPAYLQLSGEVPMGQVVELAVNGGELVTVHTGGYVPEGADAVVMIENTQYAGDHEIEVRKPVAPGENVILPGEDIEAGDLMLPAGHILRGQDIGGLMAVGITAVEVVRRPRVAIFATGDEIVAPDQTPQPGQIRDVNTYTVAALAEEAGADVQLAGILVDDFDTLLEGVKTVLDDGADMVVLSAGSSVSVRDMTADVFARLGEPGVLVHGIATRPGKPTILAVADGVPLIGLPGNPVSAFVQFLMVCTPAIYHLQGTTEPKRLYTQAKITTNMASTAGREDYIPARLVEREGEQWVEPVFFKSNLIFTLVQADGLMRIPLNTTGVEAGEMVDIRLF